MGQPFERSHVANVPAANNAVRKASLNFVILASLTDDWARSNQVCEQERRLLTATPLRTIRPRV